MRTPGSPGATVGSCACLFEPKTPRSFLARSSCRNRKGFPVIAGVAGRFGGCFLALILDSLAANYWTNVTDNM